jgi:hypothetical protein
VTPTGTVGEPVSDDCGHCLGSYVAFSVQSGEGHQDLLAGIRLGCKLLDEVLTSEYVM